MLGGFLGLIFVEQGHDLAHHDVHGIIAHLLRDRDQLDPVFGQLADVEFQLEMIAEEAAEGMDHHHIEGRGFRRARFDHALEFGAAVIGGRGAGLDIGFDQFIPARRAPCFALPLLVGDRNIMLGLPRGRYAQVKRGAGGDGWRGAGHGRFSCLAILSHPDSAPNRIWPIIRPSRTVRRTGRRRSARTRPPRPSPPARGRASHR